MKFSGCNRSHWLLSSRSVRVRRCQRHMAPADDWRTNATCNTSSSEKRLRRYDLACMKLTTGVMTKAECSGPAKQALRRWGLGTRVREHLIRIMACKAGPLLGTNSPCKGYRLSLLSQFLYIKVLIGRRSVTFFCSKFIYLANTPCKVHGGKLSPLCASKLSL
jgi:hypothetical protein